MSILFIHPPVAKACEPPAGIAKLTGELTGLGIACHVLDANLEAQLWAMRQPIQAADPWTARADRNCARNLRAIREPRGYGHVDRYRRLVADLNRRVGQGLGADSVRVSLANYQDAVLSPTRSVDLLRAAEQPECNPFFPYYAFRLKEVMERHAPEVVGFSLNFLNQALCTFAMVGVLRRFWPEIPVVMGGGLVTSWVRGANWANPFSGLVDEMVAGAGEGPLLERFGLNMGKSMPAVDHAPPKYDMFPLTEYFAPGLILPYSASRGCYWNRCAFCPEQAEGNRYRPLGRSRVITELTGLVQTHQPVLIHLLDNAVSPAVQRALITDPPGAPWYGFVRFEQNLADKGYCRALRRSGCVMLKLGLESGAQSVLDREGKGVDLDLVPKALESLRKAGIAAYVYLLFGTPSESEREARTTLDFTVRHAAGIGFLNLALFNLPLAGQARNGLELIPHSEGVLSLYAGFCHPLGWSRDKARRFLDREFRRHPALAPILRRDPPIFTSNHAAFFSRAAIISDSTAFVSTNSGGSVPAGSKQA